MKINETVYWLNKLRSSSVLTLNKCVEDPVVAGLAFVVGSTQQLLEASQSLTQALKKEGLDEGPSGAEVLLMFETLFNQFSHHIVQFFQTHVVVPNHCSKSILDLGDLCVRKIIELMHPGDLITIRQLSRAFKKVSDSHLWRRVAVGRGSMLNQGQRLSITGSDTIVASRRIPKKIDLNHSWEMLEHTKSLDLFTCCVEHTSLAIHVALLIPCLSEITLHRNLYCYGNHDGYGLDVICQFLQKHRETLSYVGIHVDLDQDNVEAFTEVLGNLTVRQLLIKFSGYVPQQIPFYEHKICCLLNVIPSTVEDLKVSSNSICLVNDSSIPWQSIKSLHLSGLLLSSNFFQLMFSQLRVCEYLNLHVELVENMRHLEAILSSPAAPSLKWIGLGGFDLVASKLSRTGLRSLSSLEALEFSSPMPFAVITQFCSWAPNLESLDMASFQEELTGSTDLKTRLFDKLTRSLSLPYLKCLRLRSKIPAATNLRHIQGKVRRLIERFPLLESAIHGNRKFGGHVSVFRNISKMQDDFTVQNKILGDLKLEIEGILRDSIHLLNGRKRLRYQ